MGTRKFLEVTSFSSTSKQDSPIPEKLKHALRISGFIPESYLMVAQYFTSSVGATVWGISILINLTWGPTAESSPRRKRSRPDDILAQEEISNKIAMFTKIAFNGNFTTTQPPSYTAVL